MVETLTRSMIASMYIILNCNIVVALVAHYNNYKVVATCNYNATLEKVKTWLTTDVCRMYINYRIEDPFSTHLQV
jgi:hypothetical protein